MPPFLVTAIMPTRRRRDWATQAIESFSKQTYQRSELLILQDEGDDLQDLRISDERVKIFTAHGRQTIGWKRNWLCGHASGSLICHWDDDDWNDPRRIAVQVRDSQDHPECHVFGFYLLHFWDLQTRQAWIFEQSQPYALGTTLCYRRDWWARNKFEMVQVGEDMTFMRKAKRCKELFSRHSDGLMVARNHGANTSGRYSGHAWRKVATSELPGGFEL